MQKSESERIGEFLARLDDSKAYSLFCERVYGKDLCQLNRMDMTQLDKLLAIFNMSSKDHVLDLGCGLGVITEYLSDVTQAHLIGIDIAEEAIRRAQDRTREKQHRLEFHEANIEKLSFPPETFSCIIAIDSLYDDCVDDLETAISRLTVFLKPHGQMGIFYTANKEPSDSVDILEPNNTGLAQVLRNQALKFQTWEFTESELILLQKKIVVAKELEEEFRVEQNPDICEKIENHSEKLAKRIKGGNARRFLYHVKRT
ncbi:MAG: class I SAM-dependent methyltransferase [Candidatus Hodarchaeales archaeon]